MLSVLIKTINELYILLNKNIDFFLHSICFKTFKTNIYFINFIQYFLNTNLNLYYFIHTYSVVRFYFQMRHNFVVFHSIYKHKMKTYYYTLPPSLGPSSTAAPAASSSSGCSFFYSFGNSSSFSSFFFSSSSSQCVVDIN